jgi:hypothetical protein
MMKNVKPLDRFLRALLAVAAVELAFFWLAGTWQIVAYVAGAILVVTAAIGFCPLYSILGIRAVDAGAKSPGKAKVAITKRCCRRTSGSRRNIPPINPTHSGTTSR